MTERALKRQRVEALRRNAPYATASALSSLWGAIASADLKAVPSRFELKRARDSVLSDTPYGPVLTTIVLHSKPPLANKTYTVVNPVPFLHKAFARGGSFTELMVSLLAQHPCSPENPWKIIFYSDEVVPGNQLAQDHRRKAWCAYFGFCEFGPLLLSRESSWLPLMVNKSSDINMAEAGISQAVAAVLKLFFVSPVDLSKGGMVLDHPNGTKYRLWCKLGMVVQDGGAHKLIWNCKGDAGTRMCMLCRNLVSVSSEIADEHGERILTCNLIHENELDLATDDDIQGTMARLKGFKTTCTVAQFKKRQQAAGFNYNEHALLNHADLKEHVRPVEQYVHDGMHCLLSNGVFHVVVWRLLDDVSEAVAGTMSIWDNLDGYLQIWHWPKRNAAESVRETFCARRVRAYKAAETFKCSASDCLSLFPVLAFYFQTVILRSGTCPAQCNAFLLLCDILEALAAIRLEATPVVYLRKLVRDFLEACVNAGFRA